MFVLLIGVSAFSQTDPKKEYIKKYSGIAVEEMKRSGVPASITLAQGLLESGAGQSRLATKANNHFGIKCHKNWKGKTIYHDDDAKGECFRAYNKPEESFRDHSDFLRYNDRYKFLFDLDPTDYKGWCHGLKKAGYATDPKYAYKLIDVLEKYELYQYDNVKPGVTAPDVLEKPVEVKPVELMKTGRFREEFTFEVDRSVFRINGTYFVYVLAGETLESIAETYNLFLKEILKYNDLKESRKLVPGEVVYIRPKSKRTVRGLDKYIVAEDGEDLRTICQRFGVRMNSVMKRNGLKEGDVLMKDQELLLR